MTVIDTADAARMDCRYDGRPAAAFLAEQQGGFGADNLGPEHVVVHDLRLERGQQLARASTAKAVVGSS